MFEDEEGWMGFGPSMTSDTPTRASARVAEGMLKGVRTVIEVGWGRKSKSGRKGGKDEEKVVVGEGKLLRLGLMRKKERAGQQVWQH